MVGKSTPHYYHNMSKGAIHKHSINKLANLKIPESIIKTLVKNIHHNAIKYHRYLVLNKRKLDNKHPPR